MQAKQFIDLLEAQGLLDTDILVELRRQVADSKTRVTPEAIARLLVDNGQLTRFQAQKLMSTLKESPESPAANSPGSNSPGSGPMAGGSPAPGNKPADYDSELDLLPPDLLPKSMNPPPVGNKAMIIDDDDEQPVDVEEIVDVDEVDEVVEVEEANDVRGRSDHWESPENRRSEKMKRRSAASSKEAADVFAAPAKPVILSKKPPKNQWDSFRIIGVSAILLLLLFGAGGLGYWFWKGNETVWLERGKQKYEERDYDAATYLYGEFLKRFSASENASLAKVRIALAMIRSKAEKSSDPHGASQIAREELPKIANEPGLATERADLTGALLSIAEKLNARADGAKSIPDKKQYIGHLDEHWQLVSNAQFIGTQERNQSEGRIKRIEETRARILRDIERSEDLESTVAKIKDALAKNDVLTAYNLRRDVVRKHVQLEGEPQLNGLIAEATALQKGLVGSVKSMPKVARESSDPVSIARKVILASQVKGPAVPDENVQGIVVVRAKGSLYGLDAKTGRVVWRTFVGRNQMGELVRVANDLESDYLMTLPAEGILRRIGAADGKVQWEVTFDAPVHDPVVDREDVFATTAQGGVYAIDLATGQVKWGKQLPQAIHVGPIVGGNRSVLYVLGDHSNLYALMRKDGNCPEVFYVGHLSGAVRVPPWIALGYVLVFDNHEPGRSQVRIIKPGEDGLSLRFAQSPIRMTGHVMAAPTGQGRKLGVVTDLGEITVFDVEPSKETNQVTILSSRVAIETSPKSIWGLMEGNSFWISGSSLTLFEIVVSQQKLNSKWVKEDQDQFLIRPRKVGNLVVSSRVLRGTMGVRVTAMDGISGEVAWDVNLGSPVSWIEPTSDTFPVFAVNSAATMYSMSKEAIAGSEPTKVIDNVGRGERSILFRTPFRLSDGKTVMVNESGGSQLLIVDPKAPERRQINRVAIATGDAVPNALAAAAGGYVLLPLNNGQLMLVDPSTGQPKTQPFQPKLEIGQQHAWIGPTTLSDQQTVLISDNTRRLYRISSGSQMRSLADRDLPRPLKGQLASMGDLAVGVSTGVTGDGIELFNGLDLDSVGSLPLQGHVTWGPMVVGELALVLSDNEGLVAMDASGKKLWETPLPTSALVGSPIEFGGDVLLAGVGGELIRIGKADGKVIAASHLREPISGTPVVFGNVLLVPGDEGIIMAVKGPEAGSASDSGVNP